MNPEALAALYASLNFIATLLLMFLCVYITWKQGIAHTVSFVILLLAAALFTLVNGLMLVCRSPELAGFLENFRWLSSAFIPPLLLIFILDFTGRGQRLSPKWLLIYFAIPLITQIFVWTNDRHHLIVQAGFDEFIQIGPYLLTREPVYGPWFWVYAIWGFILILVALYILVQDTFTTPQLEWQQFIWLFVGFFIPIVFSVIDTFQLVEPEWFKLVPFGFVLMGISFFIAITRGQFINMIPVARGYLIETLPNAVFMVDRNHRIADINPAGCFILGKTKQELLGKPAKDVLGYWPRLASVIQQENEVSTVVIVVKDIKDRSYDTHITPLRTRGKKSTGWVIVLHDITQLMEAETRASQLAAVIEQAHETIVITDLDANITYANPYFETATGYSIPEVIGKNPNILKSGIQDEVFYRGLWNSITEGEAWTNTFINKRKDGSLFYEAATIFPIKDPEGDITSYAAVKRDITPQVKAEESLHRFTQKLEKLHEISLELSRTKSFDELTHLAVKLGHEALDFDRIGIWFVDLKNPDQLCGSFGIDETGNIRDERHHCINVGVNPIHKPLLSGSQRIYYNQDQPLRNHKSEVVGTGDIAASVLWDGYNIIGYISIDNFTSRQPISSNQRELLVLFAQTIGNLASRKRIEAEVQKSERRYRLLAHNALDVIWTMDLQGHFTYVSPSVERLRGYTPEEVLLQSMQETLTSESYKIAHQVFNKILGAIQAGEIFADPPYFELEQTCKDGSTVWTEVITTLMYDQDDTPLGILGVTRDITERKKTEKDLQTYASQQALLNEITQTAIQQTDLDEMLQTLANRMGDLLEADSCYITLWDEKTQTVTPAAAYGPLRDQYKASVRPQLGEATLTESALKHEDVLIIQDAFDTPYVSQRIAEKFPARSGLALPLIANNQKLGAVLIAFNQQRQYTQAEIDLSKQAAQQIALAILKTRLLEEAEQRAKEAETLRFASAAIAGSLEQDQAIEQILEELSRVVPYDSASVLLSKGIEMEVVGARGFDNPSEILGLRFANTRDTPNKIVSDTLQPFILEDAPARYAAFRNPPHNHIHGWMGIPLLIHDNLIGMLALDSKKPDRFNQNHARLASAFAGQVAIALENARLFEETRRLAITDSLTDLYNRRHFMELARREFDRSKRYNTPLSIIMLDLDHFKKVNDTFGHLAGDQVLQNVAQICRENLRSNDIIGRYGGEEFVILLPETPLTRPADKEIETKDLDPLPTQIVAERLRQTFAHEGLEISGNTIFLTISLGIAEFTSADISIENVINHADQALLQAKNTGRNRVITWNAEE